MRNGYEILVGQPGGKRPLGSPRRRWKDNIIKDLRERSAYKILVGKPEGLNHSEELGVDRRITLKWIVGK
jgi:hypothetical protein